MALHRFQQAAAAIDVDVPIAEGLTDGFRQGLEAREMKHSPHGPQGHRPFHVGRPSDIPLNHRQARAARSRLPDPGAGGVQWGQGSQSSDPTEGLWIAIGKVIQYHDIVPLSQQAEGAVTSNESAAASDQ